MTAVPPPVPPEIERRAAEALGRHHWDGTGCGTNGTSGCLYCFGPSPADSREVALIAIAAVYGDIVEAARRDALTEAAEQIARTVEPNPISDTGWSAGVLFAARIVTDLRDATAPPRAPTASDEETR